MKIGTIIKPNKKGQVVIPKEIRDNLGIDEHVHLHITRRGTGIYIAPVKDVITAHGSEESYLSVLSKTKGAWNGDDWTKTRRKRKKAELTASAKRKASW